MVLVVVEWNRERKNVMYKVMENAAKHTCWNAEDWDGLISAEGVCAGCDEANEHPCNFCGYGDAFTTHNDLAHAENGDEQVPVLPTNEWFHSPHIYDEEDV